ncbi:tandem-95 repeat protein [bacterium]|nr:tandem-95 repeat protein [bacterium]
MKRLVARLLLLTLFGFTLLTVGCNSSSNSGSGSGSNDGNDPLPPEDPAVVEQTTNFNLTLSSYAKSDSVNSASSNNNQVFIHNETMAETLRLVTGIVMVVNKETGDEKLYNWALNIDVNAIEIETEVTLPLEKGFYDFYFLMTADQNQYAAITGSWLILEGQNAVPFIIHPVIGETIPDVHILKELAEFQFQYDNDVVSGFANPAFGISIDGSKEHLFSVNPETGLSRAFIYLPAGTYTFGLSFYDGALLKSVLVDSQSRITIAKGGGSIQLDIEPLIIENTFTYDTDNTSGIFHLVIPDEVIGEAGSISNVIATFSLTGVGNQPIEITVPLSSVGSNYEGTAIISDFVPGSISWSLRISDTSGSDNEVYAYCGQSIETSYESQTFSCDFTMVVRDFTASNPMSTLTVAVETNGFPVTGSVITANDIFVGLTGNGENGSVSGRLQLFLPGDTYLIKATSGDGTRISGTTITLVGGESHDLNLQLPSPPNSPPIAEDVTAQTDEGTSVSISLPGTDVDPWDEISWELASEPLNGEVHLINNTATYTPNEGFSGTDSFTYITTDDDLDSDPATVFVNVVRVIVPSVNNTPTAEDIVVSTNQNLQLSITLLGSDDDEGDILTYNIPAQPENATVTISGNTASFTPNEGFVGTVIFTYSVNDGSLTSEPATVTVVVLPVNNAPTARDITVSTDQNLQLYITLLGSDDDGDILVYNIPTQPENATVTVLGNIATFTPNGDFFGTDSFTYAVTDGSLTSEHATVFVTVNEIIVPPANNVPTAIDVSASTDQNVPVELTLVGSDNDEEDILQYHIKTPPEYGTYTIEGNAVTYTPNVNFFGSDSFTYTVSDGVDSSNPATVTITVNKVEEPPPIDDLVLTASFNSATWKRIDGVIKLESPLAVKIPYLDQLEVLEGNPDWFVLKLKLGKISCFYLGGNYSAPFGGKKVGHNEKHKKYWSPVCSNGKYKAGSIVEARGKITARILFADPREEMTTIRIEIEQVE